MKKVVEVLLLILLVLIPKVNYSGSTPNGGYRVKTVVIDAGHGGHDSGAIGITKVKEKNIALAVALKLGKDIKENFPDVKVIYTRDKDEFIELYERGSIANKNKADLFISIHCNASPSAESASGTEVYVLGLHKTEEQLNVAKRENSVILMEDNYKKQYDGFDPNSPESHIIFSIYQDAFLEQSIKLASNVAEQFKSRANRNSRGVKQAGFVVLWKATVPSILIELGFLSNRKEEAYLNSQQGQSFMASSIYRAFRDYKLAMEPDVPHKKSVEHLKEEPIEMSSQPVITETEKPDNEEPASVAAKPVEKIKKTETPKPVETETPVKETPAKTPPATKAVKPAPKHVEKKEPAKAATVSGLVYKVQFMASKVSITPAKDPKLKKVGEYEVEHTDYYRYMTGSFANLADAKTLQEEVRKKGYPEAFVVAYEDGVKVPVKQGK